MYQIDVNSAAPALPQSAPAGVPGYFTDGDIPGGVAPTVVPAEFLNTLMLEMLNVITAAGITPAKGNNGQLILAVQRMIEANSGNYSIDSGAANAYVVALAPAITQNINGLSVKFRAKHASTGPCTLNAGAGPAPLLREDGSPIEAGDIPLNGIVSATYDGPAGAFLLSGIVPSQLGDVAVLNIGAGLVNDGHGNLAVITAGQSADQYFYSQL